MNELRENQENQAMQQQLDHDPDFIAWSKAQESSIEEKNESLEALVRETRGMNNASL